MAVAAVVLDAGNPAVDEYVMLGLVPVDHDRDDLSEIQRILRSLGEIIIADDGQPEVIACQLQGGIICPIAPVVTDRQALVDRDHLLVEIFMVSAHEDHGVLPQKGEDEALHLHSFLPTAEQSIQDDQLVKFGVGEAPRLVQCLMKFSIKAVYIGGDIVFH